MTKNCLHILLTAWLSLSLGTYGFAQIGLGAEETQSDDNKKVRFNGMGRTSMQQATLSGAILDTLNGEVDKVTDGEFVLDLAINATPNKVTEVQGILRLRNELGGFFGAGQSIEVRELWARGIIADIIKYRVGDIDMAVSPYTLFNPIEETVLNGAALFQPQRDVIYYEQFYSEPNQRRLQGAKLEMGLKFTDVLESADLNGFISRVRSTDFFNVPTRFVGGGSLNLLSEHLKDSLGLQGEITLNGVYTWDDITVGEATSGIRNAVNSIGYKVNLYETSSLLLSLNGESGISTLNVLEDSISVSKKNGTFADVGLWLNLKAKNLSFEARFLDIDPDFFSMGAQSKRVDFTRPKTYFNRIGPQNIRRDAGLFDLTRDRAIYTFQLSDRLMDYDPRLSNTLPYGRATPNRRGIQIGADWLSTNQVIEADITASLLREVRGQGTFELKNFQLIRANATFNLHKLAGWENDYRLTLGTQFETTSRNGIEVEQIDLASNLLEIGLEAEVYPNLRILAAGMFLSSNGNEYLPVIRTFNNVRDFQNPYIVDETEALIGAGLKYNFKENTFITLQVQQFNYSNSLAANTDYSLNQVFVLYNMNF